MESCNETIEIDGCLLHEVFQNDSDKSKFRLCWENLTICANLKSSKIFENIVRIFTRSSESLERQSIDILKSVSGYADVGQMIAIMGPSGAGKTTLLSALAKKIQPTSGTININGVEISNEQMSKISGYVPQYDFFPPSLTVTEYIAFSSALRLAGKATRRVGALAKKIQPISGTININGVEISNQKMSNFLVTFHNMIYMTQPRFPRFFECVHGKATRQDRRILACDIILNLSLDGCKNSLINDLSGGEKRRLSLAAEIVTKPRILFFDEPTTGLDTSAALHVIESIKSISTNAIVLCSIHQPSMTIYNLFSHVIFLCNGKTAFFGSLKTARTFFERQGFEYPYGFDEAEYYVKILSNRIHENVEYSRETSFLEDENQPSKICQAYADSNFSKIPTSSQYSKFLDIKITEQRPHWIVQFNWLLWRFYYENRRSFVDSIISFNYYAISMVIVIIFFWGIDTRKQSGIQDAMGILYMASAETIFSTAYAPLYEIEKEIPIYRREAAMYTPSAYYVAIFVSWIPKTILKSFFLAITLFALLGTRAQIFTTFFHFLICAIVSGICGLAYGSMIASFIENNEIATIIMVPIDLVSLLMSGVYYRLRTLKWYTVGFKYLSIFYYTTEALAIAHWSQINEIECESDQNLDCISSGSQVLLQYGYEESNYWIDIFGMILLTNIMNFIAYLGMRRRRLEASKY